MKFLLFSFFLLNSVFLIAQPGSESRPIHIRIFDEKGKMITSETYDYVIKFQIQEKWGKQTFTDVTKEKIKFNNRFEVYVPYGDYLFMTIQDKKTFMSIKTLGSIDSIQIIEGNFTFDLYESYLFSIVPAAGIKITNMNLSNFNDPTFKKPVFQLSDEVLYDLDNNTEKCHAMAKEMEGVHGGSGWANNSCNDVWEPVYLSNEETIHEMMDSINGMGNNDYRVAIHPLEKNKFIRHEFFMKDTYDHRISISEDNGQTWNTVMDLKNEWHAHIIYFVEERKIGIDISNSGIVLVSDYAMKDWKYYSYDTSREETDEEPPSEKMDTVGLILTTGNWMDNYFGNFYFSE